ncbi:MAG: hypothetical protein ACC682_00795 [Gemmatimonadota bacterium]
MTTETTLSITPGATLAAAREFFIGATRMADAWIESESVSHVSFCTFRGNVSIAAVADPDDASTTRVRVTTLREEGLVPRLITYLNLQAV